ncbi:hypothetical protein HDU92_002755 [Lobulomyces angularis]|nr:hypothetical protein HDU92_002755 [Lobulomyces angularis]
MIYTNTLTTSLFVFFRLLPREVDKLILSQVGFLAQKRLARGLQLNHTEATALIASQILELIRDGKHSVSKLMQMGKEMLGIRQVLPSVFHTLKEVQVEGTFPDGTKLVTIHDPISDDDGNLELALYGSFLPIPNLELFMKPFLLQDPPGALKVRHGTIKLSENKPRIVLNVTNNGDRPIQVGSHYHFIETNAKLLFDRKLAYGFHLDIPSGTSVRFEPGETKTVTLVQISGKQVVSGGNNVASGLLDYKKVDAIVESLITKGFSHRVQAMLHNEPKPYIMDRSRYAQAFGPTTGDRVKLGDSDLWVEVERDLTVYGDEVVFGGGKVIRGFKKVILINVLEGMGQNNGFRDADTLDLVITNALIVDYTGIYKADIGIKNNIIVGIGKSGNPQIMDITPGMVIGVNTEVLSAEGKIVTAGAIDTHIHFICPQICNEALSSGITTLLGGGTGPNTGTNATTCTPGKNHVQMMYQSTDDISLNLAFTGKGNSSEVAALEDMVYAGVVGLKLHEDWGTTPAAIDSCLTICDKYDIQCTIHTDTLNESGFVEDSLAAFKGRTVHAYHSEGAGGGHAPDIIKCCGIKNVIPSSTNPTRPYTVNTIDEHLDMLMVCHHLSKNVPEDIAFAESRIRGETIGAEDWLQDIGAISIISSDSQAMGRVGEVISRTWQTANKMKEIRGSYAGDLADNFRIKRYIAKYTINPAIAHGMSHLIGSIEVGKLADLVVYKPSFFGTKPEMVIKGGYACVAMMGDANASIPTPQPVISRPMFGARPSVFGKNCVAFVSEISLKEGNVQKYNLVKRVEAVKNCRSISKLTMKLNDSLPTITVDPETYEVKVDGESISVPAAEKVCMSQSIYLY